MAVISYRIIERAQVFVVQEDIAGTWTIVADRNGDVQIHDQLDQAERHMRQLQAVDTEQPFVVRS